jgi:endonuclease/exonuclease/phosphatase family metal-dependent hydrolase
VIVIAAMSIASWTCFGPIYHTRPNKHVPVIVTRRDDGYDQDATLDITVMTFNIHHGEGTDKAIDLNRIAAVIQRASADVVALQEVDRGTKRSGGVDQLAMLSELTGMNGIFGKAKNHSGGEFGNAILSRYPIETVLNAQLPTDLIREPRSVLMGKTSLPSSDAEPVVILVWSTHFDFLPGSRVRLASVEKIRKILEDYEGIPCLLAGDMNAQPGSDTITELERDWYRVTASRPLPTYPAAEPTREIDHLFCRPADRWSVLEVTVLDDPLASDHRPVVARLRLADR